MTVQSNNQINLVRGTSKVVIVTVLNEDGTPLNLSGGKAWLCVASQPSCPLIVDKRTGLAGGSDSQAKITDEDNGVVKFYLTPEDTANLTVGRYQYDVWVETAGGHRYQVIPISAFILSHSITRPNP